MLPNQEKWCKARMIEKYEFRQYSAYHFHLNTYGFKNIVLILSYLE